MSWFQRLTGRGRKIDVGHPTVTAQFSRASGALAHQPELVWSPGDGGRGGLREHLRTKPTLFNDVVLVLSARDRAQTLNVAGEPWIERLRRALRAAWDAEPGRADVRLNVRVLTDGNELEPFGLEPGEFVTLLGPSLWAGATSRSRAVAELELRTEHGGFTHLGQVFDEQMVVSFGGHALDTFRLPSVDVADVFTVSRSLDGTALEYSLRGDLNGRFFLADNVMDESVELTLTEGDRTLVCLRITSVQESTSTNAASLLTGLQRDELQQRIQALDSARSDRDAVRSNTAVDRVVLRPGAAWVERTHRLAGLKPGEPREVVLTGLPSELDSALLQITSDVDDTVMSGVRFETGQSDDWEDISRVRILASQLDEMQEDYEAFLSGHSTQGSLVVRTSSTGASASTSRTNGMTRARDMYETRVRQFKEEAARLEDELHEVLLRAESTVGTGPRAYVTVTSNKRVGRLRVRYPSPSINWELTYDIDVSDDTSDGVTVSLVATVAQTTEEDWQNVELFVELGDDEPRLSPPVSSWPIAQDAPSVDEWMVPITSRQSEEVIHVPGRHDLRWGDRLQLTIRSWDALSRIVHCANPRIDPRVFRQAEIVAWAGPPLPAGPMSVRVDGKVVGTGRMPPLDPGERCRIGLGASGHITVSRRRKEMADAQPGTVVYQTTVRSLLNASVTMEVREDVPYIANTDGETLATHAKGAEVTQSNRRLTFRGLLTRSDPMHLEFGFMLPGFTTGLGMVDADLPTPEPSDDDDSAG